MATLKDLLVSGPARVIGNITGKSFIKEGGTSSQFLKADGSVDSNTYSTTSHNHSGTYKPVQTAVSDPTASTTTSTTFIDSISQNANGVISATKKTLPTASSTVAGITKIGASGGAAAYSHTHTGFATSGHTHDTLIAKSNEDSRITLAFGTKYTIKAGGTSYVFTMPKNPNTDTTYTFATGDSNGQIKVIPSGGSAQNVSVKGLGSAAYTESSAYATSGHTHTGYATSNHTHATSIATSTSTNQITLAFGTKYAITAGGTSYVFTMPANPNTNTTYTFATGDSNGQIKVTPSGGSAQNVSVKGLGSAAYTESSAYATSGHNHSGVYKPVQTAVSDPPTASTSTATAFIDTISQNKNGVITATKKTLPTASATVAGITTVGADGGAAAYSHTHTGYATSGHTHDTLIKASTEDSRITLAFGKKYTISAGGTSYVFAMPKNPNTDTTYTFESGDGNGQIKVTSSTGDVYNVKVSGLGSAAFTDGSEFARVGHIHTGYATSNHTHTTSIAKSTGTNQITLEFGTKYAITAGGTSYVFTMPANPDTNTIYKFESGDNKGQIKVLPSDGGDYNVDVRGLGSAAYTDISDYATSGHTHTEYATSSHKHGSITNAGAITANTTIANGDHLVITDNSDSNKIKRASITFGTSQSTYLRNDGKWGTPSTSTPLATPLFDDGGGRGIPGTVIPIARTENEIAFKGDPITYNTPPHLIFPSDKSTMALPIFMDKSGRLFMLISDAFADELINKYGYSTTTSGK